MLTGSRRVISPGGGVIPGPVGLSRVASGGLTTIGGMTATSRLNSNFPMGMRPSSSYNPHGYSTSPSFGMTSIPVGMTSIPVGMTNMQVGQTVVGETISGSTLGGAYLSSGLPRVSSGNMIPGTTTNTTEVNRDYFTDQRNTNR